MSSIDEQIRLAAFSWLNNQAQLHDQVLPINLLRKGFVYKNEQIHLMGPQGIFKPKIMDLPLTITTTPNSIYDDEPIGNDYFIYKYQGNNIYQWDNVGLRDCMLKGVPLIYFFWFSPRQIFANLSSIYYW